MKPQTASYPFSGSGRNEYFHQSCGDPPCAKATLASNQGWADRGL